MSTEESLLASASSSPVISMDPIGTSSYSEPDPFANLTDEEYLDKVGFMG